MPPNKKTPGGLSRVFLNNRVKLLFALYGEEAVTRILVNFHASWQVSAFRALILAEVVDLLGLATAKDDILGVKVVCDTL
jgi:hypothetical protein